MGVERPPMKALWRLFLLENPTPLVFLRISLGLLFAASALRFWTSGWIDALFVVPTVRFPYAGFEWVTEPGVLGIRLLFATIGLSGLAVALGWRYRIATIVLFVSFTWVELIDRTTYLNHYYLMSLLAGILIFLPLHRSCSLDARAGRVPTLAGFPRWMRAWVQIQIGIVYTFAGLAKVNADWLVRGEPLHTWLTGIGGGGESILSDPRLAIAMSWGGALYDLGIPWLLAFQPTRRFAFLAVVGFHTTVGLLFPIGVFPVLMIVLATVFFEPRSQNSSQLVCDPGGRARGSAGRGTPADSKSSGSDPGGPARALGAQQGRKSPEGLDLEPGWPQPAPFQVEGDGLGVFDEPSHSAGRNGAKEPSIRARGSPSARIGGVGSGTMVFAGFWILLQIAIPMRGLFAAESVNWTEQGYRFSWRVMLVEKGGFVEYRVLEHGTNRTWRVSPREELSAVQLKQMATQADMIAWYAGHLRRQFEARGVEVSVYADSFVSMNGRRSQRYLDPTVDLGSGQVPDGAILPTTQLDR